MIRTCTRVLFICVFLAGSHAASTSSAQAGGEEERTGADRPEAVEQFLVELNRHLFEEYESMRYMSVFVQSDGEWKPMAQSLTDIIDPRTLPRD